MKGCCVLALHLVDGQRDRVLAASSRPDLIRTFAAEVLAEAAANASELLPESSRRLAELELSQLRARLSLVALDSYSSEDT